MNQFKTPNLIKEAKEIDIIGIGRDPNANLLSKIRYVLNNPKNSIRAVQENLRRRKQTSVIDKVNEIFTDQVLSDKCEILHFEHHLCHIASSYFVGSSGEEALGFSMDGSGDFVSCMLARCHDQEIAILEKVFLPH